MLTGVLFALFLTQSGHQRMIDLLRDVARQSREDHPYLGEARLHQLRAELERSGGNLSPATEIELRAALGEAELRLGQDDAAIEHLLRAYELVHVAGSQLNPGWKSRAAFRLGVAYLKSYQTRACHPRGSTPRCVFPVREPGGDPESSEAAIRFLTEALLHGGGASPSQMASRWLLNVAYMTLGRYPGDVPPQWLLDETWVASDGPFPRFEDVAAKAGIDTLGLSGSVVPEDFDVDGDLDLLVSQYPPGDQLNFFRNEGGLRFEDRTEEASLIGLTAGLNMVQGDYDNDGDSDVLVLRGAWAENRGRHPNSLIRNNGDGTFTDVTFELGLGDVHYPTQTASWADYDGDGDIDLYVGNETTPAQISPAQLFRNDGVRFVDVAAEAGVTNLAFTKGVVWGDYDADDLPDIYVSNLRGPNRLYRNNGDGTFEDVAPRLGVQQPEISFPTWFWDFDNDGHLDIYVTAYNTTVAHLAAFHLGVPIETEFSRLYKNDGRGGFRDVALAVGLARPSAPMGANFGDLDGDGFLDLYLGTGDPNYTELMPNVMYRSREAQSFADVTAAGGFGHLQKGHGIAFVDLDGDGDHDVFQQMGGGFRGDIARDVLFENKGFGNRWVRLQLVGRESNRATIGARIRAQVLEAGSIRSIYRHVNSGGSFGANPLAQTIGLGKAEAIELIEIHWPTTGKSETARDVGIDRDIVWLEGRGPNR